MKIKLHTKTWQGLPIYIIDVNDLTAVRSAVTTRKLPSYSKFVNQFLHGFKPPAPAICFVGGDGRLRVKYGNLLYWTAKETHTQYISCVFPKGIDYTDSLLSPHMKSLGIEGRYF